MELLIVGGGLAAQRCIEVLRAAGDDRPITVVCDEPVRPYDRPPLSKEGLLGPVDTAVHPRCGRADAAGCRDAPARSSCARWGARAGADLDRGREGLHRRRRTRHRLPATGR